MSNLALLAQTGNPYFWPMVTLIAVVVVLFSLVMLAVKQYKRCPSNRVLVVYGRTRKSEAAQCIHGGWHFVVPLAQDYAFGRDFVTAFKTALAPTGAKLVFEEYGPPMTTDFTAPIQRIFDALAKEQGRKIIFVNWAGAGNPLAALKAMGPERQGIEISTGGNILPALVAYKDFPGLEVLYQF